MPRQTVLACALASLILAGCSSPREPAPLAEDDGGRRSQVPGGEDTTLTVRDFTVTLGEARSADATAGVGVPYVFTVIVPPNGTKAVFFLDVQAATGHAGSDECPGPGTGPPSYVGTGTTHYHGPICTLSPGEHEVAVHIEAPHMGWVASVKVPAQPGA